MQYSNLILVSVSCLAARTVAASDSHEPQAKRQSYNGTNIDIDIEVSRTATALPPSKQNIINRFQIVNVYTTICATPTTFAYNNQTYTATSSQTITVACPCTLSSGALVMPTATMPAMTMTPATTSDMSMSMMPTMAPTATPMVSRALIVVSPKNLLLIQGFALGMIGVGVFFGVGWGLL